MIFVYDKEMHNKLIIAFIKKIFHDERKMPIMASKPIRGKIPLFPFKKSIHNRLLESAYHSFFFNESLKDFFIRFLKENDCYEKFIKELGDVKLLDDIFMKKDGGSYLNNTINWSVSSYNYWTSIDSKWIKVYMERFEKIYNRYKHEI